MTDANKFLILLGEGVLYNRRSYTAITIIMSHYREKCASRDLNMRSSDEVSKFAQTNQQCHIHKMNLFHDRMTA